ncbi:MAG: helix-turn-helix protein [Syntrophus sp. PtaB.Bin001]|nr:MAG: helix-turn-helix protein [Syntrophus sp. PtaB.Bin001]
MSEKRGKSKPDPEITKTFSENLKSCIKTNDWLAGKAGISPQAVSEYTTGKSLPRGDILYNISKAIDKSMEWLLTGKDPMADDFWAGREAARLMCEEIIEIVKSGDAGVIQALKNNIDEFKKSVKKDEKIRSLEDDISEIKRQIGINKKKTNSTGQLSDTHKKPATSTGSKEKVG